jgi:parallel beta-helix repeat protein
MKVIHSIIRVRNVGSSKEAAVSANALSRFCRRALWVALAVFAAVLLTIPVVRLLDWDPTNAPPATDPVENTARCGKYAAVGGSDDAEGTKSRPFRSAQRVVDSLQPGQSGCLRAGTYTESDEVLLFEDGGTQEGRIVLQAYPGEKATVRAQLKVPEGSDYITVRDLTLDGTYAPTGHRPTNRGRWSTQPSPFVQGDNTQWINNDITKRNREVPLWHTGVCFLIGGESGDINTENTLIKGNRIHNCGPQVDQPKGPDNHGVYVSEALNTVIRDNLIYDNGERGVQLYPNARDTLVEGNVVDGNGQGLLIDANSSNNTVRNNVFSNPRASWNVYQGPKLSGSGNRVKNNCFWASKGSSAFRDGNRITASGNVVANPRYRDRWGFKITNRTCLAKYRGSQAR